MNHELLKKFFVVNADQLDAAYDEPACQDDLAAVAARVADVLAGHTVLELACGTGYWTRIIAETADAVHATDISSEVLARAEAHGLPDNVTFGQADAFDLPADIGEYTAVFAGLWWSHVKREEQEKHLAQLRAKLGKDVLLVLVDECYVEGLTTVIARTDLEGNTHQQRMMAGERVEIVKNFPTDSYLRKKLGNAAREIRVRRSEHYWLLTARLK
ncbi:class I SAM-dependent methyltransferase [Pseudoduganella buxea]|uniref:Methyltransferase domain-containing protein n=1 Tax=Pseudoduganella buxea TaxID=1949069 RepID=A0A6I3T2E4_9BURK|nr:class I SAM-dependent methyltransferase [Pseudoduganella buxea]MTV54642.1 methyltransferase domain-containing protein [Pseudoduganella buxea]GGC18976.1 hypothetical protein GCM10011572_45610 [Pseudoduganella buxea]